jgi:small neutral amino acid transporter SnatA (MarC family)
MRDLVASHPEEPEVADEMVAVVPIGTPMLVGPATSINTAGVDGAI